jgi:hypothetical protein
VYDDDMERARNCTKWPVFARKIYNMENARMLSRMGVLLMVVSAACAASQSKPAKPWRVELATSGGITGRGNGTIAIDSDGNVSVKTISGASCTTKGTAEELERIETLLATSHSETWGKYIPENPCCDRIEYKLTYDKYTAEWIDDPLPMPADLVKLSEELARIRQVHACK